MTRIEERNPNEKHSTIESIKFLYVRHIPQNVESDWEEIKDCDVILIEFVLPGVYKEIFNSDLVASTYPNEEGRKKKLQIREWLKDIQPDLPYLASLMIRALDKNKVVQAIDTTQEGEAFLLDKESREFEHKASTLFLEGQPNKALSSYKECIIKLARSCKIRDIDTVIEIERLLAENSDRWNGKKVAVIQGAIHVPTHHKFRNRNTSIRVEKKNKTAPHVFTPAMWTLRKMAFLPNVTITDVEFKESMLSEFIPTLRLRDKYVELEEQEALTTRKFGVMSNEEIESLWNKIFAASLENDSNKSASIESYSQQLKQIAESVYSS